MISDRFVGAIAAYRAAEEVIEELSSNGGMYLYEKYLATKDVAHCSQRLVQFFEEGIQVSSYEPIITDQVILFSFSFFVFML